MSEQGDRRRAPSIRDVADAAGVSYQTVSRVLNHHPKIAPRTADRVRAAIDQLGYRPNRAARALVTSRTRTIGVVLTARALYGPFSTFLAIEEAARHRGYAVSASPHASDDAEDIVRAVDSLVAHGIDGIVAIAPQDRARDAMHHVGVRVPVLTLQGPAEEVDGYGFDQRGAARLATAHLLELGHRVVAHLPGPHGWAEAEERRRGYVEELERHGLVPVLGEPGDWTPASGHRIGRALLARGDVTAVFSANDEMAVGLLAAAAEAGLTVPDDLSVVGFDDIPTARYLVPPLTTIQQDFGDLGARVVSAMIDEIEHGGPRDHPRALGSRLVVRGSTAKVPDRLRHATTG